MEPLVQNFDSSLGEIWKDPCLWHVLSFALRPWGVNQSQRNNSVFRGAQPDCTHSQRILDWRNPVVWAIFVEQPCSLPYWKVRHSRKASLREQVVSHWALLAATEVFVQEIFPSVLYFHHFIYLPVTYQLNLYMAVGTVAFCLSMCGWKQLFTVPGLCVGIGMWFGEIFSSRFSNLCQNQPNDFLKYRWMGILSR